MWKSIGPMLPLRLIAKQLASVTRTFDKINYVGTAFGLVSPFVTRSSYAMLESMQLW